MSGLAPLRPWLLFLLGGVVLALLVHGLVPEREPLIIDAGLIARVVTWEQDVLGRPLTEEEREATVSRLVDEEILLAEARRRGHTRRGSVHSRLLKKMRFLLLEELTSPSDAEMRAVYDANPDMFRRPGSLAFDHVFFRPGSPSTPEDPARFLLGLATEASWRDLGDPHPHARRGGLWADADVRRQLGDAVAKQLLEAPLATWVGPIHAPDGVHYARVRARVDPSPVPFEEALPHLLGAWTMERQREAVARRTAELVSRYSVVVEGEE